VEEEEEEALVKVITVEDVKNKIMSTPKTFDYTQSSKDLRSKYKKQKPIYKNFEGGKLVEVSKKDWNKKSGQIQRFKKSGEVKSTVARNKGYTEREHEWGRIRYDKGADDKIGKFSKI